VAGWGVGDALLRRLGALFVFSDDHVLAQKPVSNTHLDNGRYQTVAASPTFENVLWVMDTRTGEVKAYRFVNAATPGTFRIQEVPSIHHPLNSPDLVTDGEHNEVEIVCISGLHTGNWRGTTLRAPQA
jgi:hypothetical protein